MDTEKSQPQLTFGAEEEFMVCDANGKPLNFNIFDLSSKQHGLFGVSQEVHVGSLEVSTPICSTLRSLAGAVGNQRNFIRQETAKLGGWVCGRSTIPWLLVKDIPKLPKADKVISDYQDVVGSLLTFGLHVHIGNIPEHLFTPVYNAWRYYSALITALSANSCGSELRDTKIASTRTVKLSSLPRSGLPNRLSHRDDLIEMMSVLEVHGLAESYQDWQDFRFHQTYKTLELRMADISRDDDSAAAIACFAAAISISLVENTDLNTHVNDLNRIPTYFLKENRWQATRHGHTNARFMTLTGIRPASIVIRELNDSLKDIYAKQEVPWVHEQINKILSEPIASFDEMTQEPLRENNEIRPGTIRFFD